MLNMMRGRVSRRLWLGVIDRIDCIDELALRIVERGRYRMGFVWIREFLKDYLKNQWEKVNTSLPPEVIDAMIDEECELGAQLGGTPGCWYGRSTKGLQEECYYAKQVCWFLEMQYGPMWILWFAQGISRWDLAILCMMSWKDTYRIEDHVRKEVRVWVRKPRRQRLSIRRAKHLSGRRKPKLSQDHPRRRRWKSRVRVLVDS